MTPAQVVSHLRRRRRLLVGALLCAGGLSACGSISSQTALQPATIGPVQVQTTFALCGFGAYEGDGYTTGCETTYGAPTGQVLLGYEVPVGTTLPTSFSVPASGFSDTTLTFSSSPAYASALAVQYTTMPGSQWFGYISQETSGAGSSGEGGIATQQIPLPAEPAGTPYPGPLAEVTALGDRITADSGTDNQGNTLSPDRPLNCQDSDTAGTSLDLTGTVSCFDDSKDASVATEDLAVAPPTASSVQAGQSTSLPFTLNWAGPADPGASFTLTAASTAAGATVTPASATVNPSSAASTPLAVTFAAPAVAPPGNYTVTLTATSPGGAAASGTATVAVSAPPAASVTPQAAPPPPPAPAPLPPVVETMSVARSTPLSSILDHGLPVTIGCNEACLTVVDLLIYQPPAKRAGIARAVPTVLIGRAYVGHLSKGKTTIRLRLYPVARTDIIHLARFTLMVRTTSTQVGGGRTSALLAKLHLHPDCRVGGHRVQPCIAF
ncbi:MAG TPA: hypothetical protein VHX88_21740 [Solirubrobacteraceae bacterium]|jgi:hypothetical protein|nr:hypothetical protein [Solirubrobacteraceae bacterium]